MENTLGNGVLTTLGCVSLQYNVQYNCNMTGPSLQSSEVHALKPGNH